MSYDEARLAHLTSADADASNRHRVRAVLEYLDIRDDDRVLDCGCGLGWFLKAIGDLHRCRLFGVDADATRLAHAARELDGRAMLAVARAGALPFPPGSFDKVVLAEVLEHLDDDRAALLEIRRVLKPGGVLAVTVPNRRYPFWWDPINRSRERFGFQPIRHGMLGGIWTNHLRLYRHEEIVDLVRQCGFTVDESRTLVRFCLPFAHNLVYGLGKWLVDSGLLLGADRFRYADGTRSMLNPLTWVLGLVGAIDRFNVGQPADAEPSVSIAVKATKG